MSDLLQYLKSRALSEAELYTLELLFKSVAHKFEVGHWTESAQRAEYRESEDYESTLEMGMLVEASSALQELVWLSFQGARRELDLRVLAFLPKLKVLVLNDTSQHELSPLCLCENLTHLHLSNCGVVDLADIVSLKGLEMLDVGRTPLKNVSALECHRSIKELTFPSDYMDELSQLSVLPSLEKLIDGLGAASRSASSTIKSFEMLPEMPRLRVIHGMKVGSLEGIQRFSRLENIVNLFGDEVETLEPLSELRYLTHVYILSSAVCTLEPLGDLLGLRCLCVKSCQEIHSLEPLRSLPLLHEVQVEKYDEHGAREPHRELGALRSELVPWDVEFCKLDSDTPEELPKLEVVSGAQFWKLAEAAQLEGRDEEILAWESDWVDSFVVRQLDAGKIDEDDYQYGYFEGTHYERVFHIDVTSSRVMRVLSKMLRPLHQFLCRAESPWLVRFEFEDDSLEYVVGAQAVYTMDIYEQKVLSVMR